MTVKEFINKIVSDVYDAGVDIGTLLEKKDHDVNRQVDAMSSRIGRYPSEAQIDEIEFGVFGENSRDTWQMKAKAGSIANVFNQEIQS